MLHFPCCDSHSTTFSTSQAVLVVFLKLLSEYFVSTQSSHFCFGAGAVPAFTACCLEEEEEGEEAAATLVSQVEAGQASLGGWMLPGGQHFAEQCATHLSETPGPWQSIVSACLIYDLGSLRL